ncbi:MAG: Lipoprotein-related protein [Pseudomonas sp.]|nr:Lipoprotein-related protein [Pseudomonas sp.]
MKKLALIFLTALLGACSTVQSPTQPAIEGEVFYLQRMALPPAATLHVSLHDVSKADAPVVVLARQSGPIEGQVPLPFHLAYDPKQVQAGHRYAVSARIELEGKLLFISTHQHNVQLNDPDQPPLRIRVDSVQ